MAIEVWPEIDARRERGAYGGLACTKRMVEGERRPDRWLDEKRRPTLVVTIVSVTHLRQREAGRELAHQLMHVWAPVVQSGSFIGPSYL